MIEQQLRRLRLSRRLDEIVIATSTKESDQPLVALANRCGVRWFRGSENDVLDRYVGAMREARADVVIRTTADCPLIDPEVVDRVVADLVDSVERCDYSSNVITRTFPKGLDVEAMHADVLERVNRLASTVSAREHVTTFVYQERPDLWFLRRVVDAEDNSDLTWTVDTPEDLVLIRQIYDEMDLSVRTIGYREIVAHVRRASTDRPA